MLDLLPSVSSDSQPEVRSCMKNSEQVLPLTVGDKGSLAGWDSYLFICFPAGVNLDMTVDLNNTASFFVLLIKDVNEAMLLPFLCPLQHALDLQLAVANILQLLVNSDRNQQVLCEACLHQRLLLRCSHALGDEDHPLHPPLQRMFERLASQALQPMALR